MRHPIAVKMHLFEKAIKFTKAFLSRWSLLFWKFLSHHCNAKRFKKSNIFEDPLSCNEHNDLTVHSF